MDSFYYNLLNIGKEKQDSNSFYKTISKIIEEEITPIRQNNSNLEGLCKYVSNNINLRLKELNFDSKIVNLKEEFGLYDHEFILTSYVDLNDEINYILIDPTYSQFVKKEHSIVNKLEEFPSCVLERTEDGKEMLKQLLCVNYIKINDDDLKRYIGSFMNESDINNLDFNISDIILERRK